MTSKTLSGGGGGGEEVDALIGDSESP